MKTYVLDILENVLNFYYFIMFLDKDEEKVRT